VNTILVTGATGCVGSNLIVELLKQGYHVKAFHRETSNQLTLEGLNVEHCIGDVRSPDSLCRAMRGCDTVFHAAGMVSFWKRKRDEQFAINVVGTRNVVDACLQLGVSKLVHTSSVAALGYRTDGELVDETTAYNWGQRIGYKYTKHLAELEVMKGISTGLNATLVNPSVIIGPRDVYIHGGQIVRDVKRGLIPAYIHGGMNVVRVHDIVAGHIAAAIRGRNGERYILGGINLTHKEVFCIAALIVGGRAPFIKIPAWFVKAIARSCDAIGEITRRQPWITSDLVSGAGMNNWYSIEKAQRELGYIPTSIETAMREAYEWYVEKKML
jgi:dihydroflavonol-4-reductase